MPQSSAEEYREKAARQRERGNKRLAGIYERRAEEVELLAELEARTERRTMTVQGRRYRVSVSYNDHGEWYGSAHAAGSVCSDAHVDGQTGRDAVLSALRAKLAA